jgi:hypothetical protein
MSALKISGRDIRKALTTLRIEYKADGANVAAQAVETSSDLLDDEMCERLACFLTERTSARKR